MLLCEIDFAREMVATAAFVAQQLQKRRITMIGKILVCTALVAMAMASLGDVAS
jgi:hypothetical protein